MLTAPPRRGDRSPAPSGRPGRRAAPAPDRRDAGTGSASRPGATAALAVLTAASAAGLARVFSGHGWVGPVVATIAVVHLLCWALRRARVGAVASAPLVVAGIILMVAWTVLGRYTVYGIPSPGTWDHAVTALQNVGNEFSSMVAPVTPTTAFQLLAVGGAAVAGALADWLAFRWRAPLAAVLPGLVAFVFCATSGQGPGRGVVVGLEVAAMCTFLLMERATGGGQVWFAGTRSGIWPWAALTGGIVTAAAVVAAVALSPALPRRDGVGMLGWRSVSSGGHERIVPNPLVDLRTRLVQEGDRPVFLVSSSVPSYWRLTALDTFDGTTWSSTGLYGGFGSRLPGAPPAGAGVRTVRATFDIQELQSVWLPAQFDPVSVQGVQHVTYDSRSNSLITSKATSDNLTYSVTSYQYLDTLSAAALETAPPVSASTDNSRYLELPLEGPRGLDPAVQQLADRLTAVQPTEYDRALAIQDYLRGAPFTYSLNPPSDGADSRALANFLFITHTGYCQQFAGAFAVLARAAGLPTRLAMGFTTGQAVSGGQFQVHDRDAHTWPEVYFGPKFGWVPFEPTPGFAVPGTSRYTGISGASSGPTTPTATTVPTTVPGGGGSGPTTIPKPKVTTSPRSEPAGSAPAGGHGISPWWLVLPGAVALWLLLTGGAPVVVRRLRRRRAGRAGSRAVVLNTWAEVMAELDWHGIGRRPDETDDEFARRATVALRRMGLREQWTYGGVEQLAAMARRASFAASVPEGLGEQAEVAAEEIMVRLSSLTSRGRRVARWWTPPAGAGRWLAGAVGPGGREAGADEARSAKAV